MTQPIEFTLETNGAPPDIAGKICEGFICEGFECDGQPVASANVTYLKFDELWYRLCFEFRLIFWRPFNEEPKPWAVAEKSWVYPHTDIGAIAGVVGQKLVSYEMHPTPDGSKVVFSFENGLSIEIEDRNDSTSYVIGN